VTTTTLVALASVFARGPSERGRPRSVLSDVSLEAGPGVLAVLGAPRDGAALFFDVIDGAIRPRRGRVTVLGAPAADARRRVARVAVDAPLPSALRVEEVCDLAATLRGEPRRPATARLGVLGVAALARRPVRTLSHEERRAVAIAIALSSEADVVLLEEPLLAIDPVAPSLVIEALRSRVEDQKKTDRLVIVTTASARDATRLGDRMGRLSAGVYTSITNDDGWTRGGPARMRVVTTSNAGPLVAAITADDEVRGISHVATTVLGADSTSGPRAAVITISGPDMATLARALTRAIASSGAAVELIEPMMPMMTGGAS
jgi:ABC-type multidrug transport system ATPase subunit